MAANPEILADGQLPSSKATLFTATGRTIVRLINAHQVSGGTQTVIFYVKKAAGTSRLLSRAVLATDEFAQEEQIETLDIGDQIEGQSTNATSVDYLIMGVKIA